MLADPSKMPVETLNSGLEDETHYYRHGSTLHGPAEKMQSSQYLPTRFPFLLATNQNDNIRDYRHALQDDCERHEEADRAPHGAEVTVAMAVFFVREVLAFACERGTTAVETVSVVDSFAAGLRGNMSMRCS